MPTAISATRITVTTIAAIDETLAVAGGRGLAFSSVGSWRVAGGQSADH